MSHLTGAVRGGSRDGLAGWRLWFPFSEETIDSLKRTIPSAYREWNEEEKYWWIDLRYEDRLLRIFPGLEAYMRQAPLF